MIEYHRGRAAARAAAAASLQRARRVQYGRLMVMLTVRQQIGWKTRVARSLQRMLQGGRRRGGVGVAGGRRCHDDAVRRGHDLVVSNFCVDEMAIMGLP